MKKIALGLLFSCLLAASAVADTVELKNRDKIDVNVVEETDKNLVVEHPQLGKIVIPNDELMPPTPPNPCARSR